LVSERAASELKAAVVSLASHLPATVGIGFRLLENLDILILRSESSPSERFWFLVKSIKVLPIRADRDITEK